MRATLVAGAAMLAFCVDATAPAAAQTKDRDLCKSASGQERVAACTRVLDDTALSNSDREWFLNERGIAYTAVENWEKAIGDFTESLKFNPNDPAVYANRSDAYRDNGDNDKAVADADQAIKLDPKYTRAYYLRGRAQYEKSDYDGAISSFIQTTKRNPKFEAAYYYRGRSYFHKADYKRAIADLTQSAKMDPNFADTWFYRGLSHRRLKNANAAMPDYNKAIALNPNHAGALNGRAAINVERGEYDSAIVDLTKAIDIRPTADRFLNRGAAYRRKGEFERALADLNESIKLDATDGDTYYLRGLVFSRQENFPAALADLRKAADLKPDEDFIRKALAKVEATAAASPRPAPQATPASAAPAAVALPPASTFKNTDAGGKRVALVIGNGQYQHSSQLSNPRNDAQDVAGTLQSLGFEVVEGRDLDRTGMDNAIRQFARKLDGAALAMLFYAGHGLQVNGRNYLLPVDAKIERAADLGLDAFDVQKVIEQMEAEPRINLIFLDACRDNPLSRSLARKASGSTRSASVAEGLAPIQSAAGTLIAYATQPDNVALDGDGRNSPFTAALLKHMITPGLEVESMMKHVRLDVISATKNRQVPWGHSSLVGNVYLKSQ